tara:strand:- start:29 stop:466 length:438 start_codon:yes stop_codon:yes gene_type:complete
MDQIFNYRRTQVMKMSQLKMVIREVVREEIRLGLKEILGEIKKQPIQKPKLPKKQSYSKNPVLNEVLNETQTDDEWKTMGGEKYTSERMGEIMGNSYKDLMNDDSGNANGSLAAEMGVNPNDPAAAFLKKDYRELMNAVDKKQGK